MAIVTKVAIRLGLYNGARQLHPQIDSHFALTMDDWTVIASDDGSLDGGPAILRAYADRAAPGQILVAPGPKRDPAANVLSLLSQVPAGIPHAAFRDQDDARLPHTPQRALSRLNDGDADQPAVYTSRTLICDQNLRGRRPSGRNRKPPGFRNALVRNIVSGNTIVLNPAGLDLVRAAAPEAGDVVMHDWWVYQVISGAGGRVVVDPEPGLLYRQHVGNLVGANDGLRALAARG